MKKLSGIVVLAFILVILAAPRGWSQTQKTFQTKYTTIYYSEDADIDDFIWRIGGQRLEISSNPELASHRIDDLVDRVQALLDMWPPNFQVAIFLHRGALKANETAFYEKSERAIHVSVDYASDGVLAHELAHASIEAFFAVPPPSKMQEILAQYVDKHLWNDY